MVKQKIFDKDGVPFTSEEVTEYENDLWNNRNSMSKEVAIRLWNKWGKRLGFPHPEDQSADDE